MNCVHPGDQERVHQAWLNTLAGDPFNIDFRIVTAQGITFANSRGNAVCDKRGNLKKFIGTLQDITESKLKECELSKARELAEKSIKVRETFLANMSHEIRTPMNAILGFIDLLYDTAPNMEQKEFLDAIHFSGKNLLVVINDILDLSKIQSGNMCLEKCDFDLRELVTSVLGMLSAKAANKKIELLSQIGPDIPVLINGDPVRLNQVLTNLISNAIKFTQKGNVTLTVDCSFSGDQDVLIDFDVTDTGVGIPEDKRSLIFDAFVQGSDDTTRKYGGTGLGLSIVKNLIELQDGKISVSSQVDIGSTFKVQLPFNRANAASVAQSAQTLPPNKGVEKLRGIEVLVVEDNNVNQLLVRKVLEKAACKIDFASTGKEALLCLRSKRYDVILMDIQMPEMDGYEATAEIRQNLTLPFSETPIIAMTANAFGSDVTRCISAGMNDYISKPFKANDLYAKIGKYVK